MKNVLNARTILRAAFFALSCTPFTAFAQTDAASEAATETTRDSTAPAQTNSAGSHTQRLAPVTIAAPRPFAMTTVQGASLQRDNIGQDLPFLLQHTPSMVVTSDAGNGTGYTAMRIRGVDASRINVGINGIPLNDAESQQVYWVDLPDIVASSPTIEIHRGVGTSVTGTGAFGASVALYTAAADTAIGLTLSSSYGSLNTSRNSLQFSSGLFADGRLAVSGRISTIHSDGYIERAASDLRSYYGVATYTNGRHRLQFVVFGGYEHTYQAWFGVPSDSVAAHRRYNPAGLMPNGSFYANQADDYTQNHYQLHYSTAFSQHLTLETALHYTRGKGYYEEYMAGQNLHDYNFDLTHDVVLNTDLVRRRWLSNDFIGGTWNLRYYHKRFALTWGGALNTYAAQHYGQVTWTATSYGMEKDYQYYSDPSRKNDYTSFIKVNYDLQPNRFNVYLDAQYRYTDYRYVPHNAKEGETAFGSNTFFNPKGGLVFTPNRHTTLFASVAVGHKEPSRDDYLDNPTAAPKPETLTDYELGWKQRFASWLNVGANAYYMDYINQLAPTGKINDNSAYVRQNIARSYRAGLELNANMTLAKQLRWSVNATFSQNKIQAFTEYLDDYRNGGQRQLERTNTDLAFSPNATATSVVRYKLPLHTFRQSLEFSWSARYVGEQFIDNSSDAAAALHPYLLHDLAAYYTFRRFGVVREIRATAAVRNIFGNEYESNGWTYRYFDGFGNLGRTVGLFPQAGRLVSVGIEVAF